MDLNLLIALDALLEEGSVGAAADRLHLSQPAMSRTLSRIRRTLGDEVLVRSGRAMLPTAYAESIRAEVHELVHRSAAVLNGAGALDLSRLQRTFTLRCHDALTDLIAPTVVTEVHRVAPEVRLRFLAEPAGDGSGLHRAETDLEIGSVADGAPDTRTRRLGSSPLVLVGAVEDRLPPVVTLEHYCTLLHVTVSRRGRLHDPVDDALEVEGRSRHVLATVPTSRVALDLVAEGGIVTVVPELVYQASAADARLLRRPLPIRTAPVDVTMQWHRRHDADAAHTWLRRLVERAVEARLAHQVGPR